MVGLCLEAFYLCCSKHVQLRNFILKKRGQIVLTDILIGPPRMTRFEKARIVGARALQIAMGAPVLTEIAGLVSSGSIDIAVKELKEKVLPITIRRRLPDGYSQDIPIQWLEW
jgi:DNA-directed RNA polymerase subunit K/omega